MQHAARGVLQVHARVQKSLARNSKIGSASRLRGAASGRQCTYWNQRQPGTWGSETLGRE